MPIRERHRYPPEWDVISLWLRVIAGWRCEWCNAEQGLPHPITGSKVVLTVAHLDHRTGPEDVRPSNLAALCQRCHLAHDRPLHRATRSKMEDLLIRNQEQVARGEKDAAFPLRQLPVR